MYENNQAKTYSQTVIFSIFENADSCKYSDHVKQNFTERLLEHSLWEILSQKLNSYKYYLVQALLLQFSPFQLLIIILEYWRFSADFMWLGSNQSPGGAPWKKCCQNFLKIYRTKQF